MEPKLSKMEPFQILMKIGTWSNLRTGNPKIKVPKSQKNVKTLKTHLKPLRSKCSGFAKNWTLDQLDEESKNVVQRG